MSVTQESVRIDPRKPIEKVATRVFLTADQDNLTGDAWNKITLDSRSHDLGLNFDITTNNRFDVPVSGLYRIYGQVMITAASIIADKAYGIGIFKNGAVTAEYFAHASVVSTGLTINIVEELYLEKDDYIELHVHPGVGAGTDTIDVLGGTNYSFMTISLITKDGIRQ